MILRLIQRLLHKDDRTGRFGFMDEKNYKAIIEAILFTMGESVELDKLADALELDNKTTKAIIEEMMEEWKKEDRGVAIMELDGAYQMCTRTEMYEYLIRIAKQPKKRVLTVISDRIHRILCAVAALTPRHMDTIMVIAIIRRLCRIVQYLLWRCRVKGQFAADIRDSASPVRSLNI